MKFLTSILLSTLCLTFSAVSSANEIEYTMTRCAQAYDFNPDHSELMKSTPASNGYTVKTFHGEVDERDTTYIDSIGKCFTKELFNTMFGSYDSMKKMSAEEEKIKGKEFDDIINSLVFSKDTITVNKNKTQFIFNATTVKVQTREELCADLKGKYDTHPFNKDIKVDRYAFCMGTQVHQGPTCQNSHGDPCGTKYDKSRAGYTIKKD